MERTRSTPARSLRPFLCLILVAVGALALGRPVLQRADATPVPHLGDLQAAIEARLDELQQPSNQAARRERNVLKRARRLTLKESNSFLKDLKIVVKLAKLRARKFEPAPATRFRARVPEFQDLAVEWDVLIAKTQEKLDDRDTLLLPRIDLLAATRKKDAILAQRDALAITLNGYASYAVTDFFGLYDHFRSAYRELAKLEECLKRAERHSRNSPLGCAGPELAHVTVRSTVQFANRTFELGGGYREPKAQDGSTQRYFVARETPQIDGDYLQMTVVTSEGQPLHKGNVNVASVDWELSLGGTTYGLFEQNTRLNISALESCADREIIVLSAPKVLSDRTGQQASIEVVVEASFRIANTLPDGQ